jgi:hypothetical protein
MRKYYLATLGVSFFVFVFSIIGAKYYIAGDQVYYRLAYEGMTNLNLRDAYLFYYSQISSLELGHFLLTWIMSGIKIDKDVFMAGINGLLVFYLMKLFEQWKVNLFVAVITCITNYYLFGLYFSAERLKFGFLFFIIAAYYASSNKKSILFSGMSIVSHSQMALLYAALFSPSLIKRFFWSVVRLIRTFKIRYKGSVIPSVTLVIALIIMSVFLGEQLAGKFQYYQTTASENSDSLGLLRAALFFCITLLYAKNRIDVFLHFIPLLLVVSLIGGDRVNALAYVVFMTYALRYKHGLNFGILFTSLFYIYKTYDFLVQIVETGQGY